MADSIREQVLAALKELLEEVTTGNDYNTDMGNNVNLGLRAPLEENDLPAMVVMEGVENVQAEPLTKNTCFLPVMVHGYTTYDNDDDGTWSQIGNKMIADIVKIIGTDTTLGGLVVDIEPGQRTNEDPEGETKVQAVQVDFVIQYRTGYLDPYN